jgi:hypothetical protein
MQAKELYIELNKLYSSEHNDNHVDMRVAHSLLEEVLESGVDPNLLISKMKEMISNLDSAYKTKLSTVIMNRFWEKTFTEMIPYKPFLANI